METVNSESQPPERKRKVLLVDDHPVLREGLAKLINGENDLVVCAQARSAPEALVAIEHSRPDAVVLDLSLSEGHGLELIKEIRARHNPVPILVFTMFEDTSYALRALRAGAQGYLNKQESSERLVNGLRAILAGHYAFDAEVTKICLEASLRPVATATDPRDRLGDRELEVFELLGKGIGTRKIATQLGRSVKTIETYRARIKRKLNLKNGNELIREAVRWVERRGSGLE
jgi:DNA-binding NarL/FixJ family response regulator